MDAGFDPKAYPITLNASAKFSKPSFFKPSKSYLERYSQPRSVSLPALRLIYARFGIDDTRAHATVKDNVAA
jgi:hypothetical protein